jgi:hypothetical protein
VSRKLLLYGLSRVIYRTFKIGLSVDKYSFHEIDLDKEEARLAETAKKAEVKPSKKA